ncbi:MAG: hypothetical protein ACXIUQ_13910 [Cecembia sp.]
MTKLPKTIPMLTKSQVKKQLDNLPEEFSLDELVEQLIFIQKVEKGLKDSDENKIITETELDKKIEKWFE